MYKRTFISVCVAMALNNPVFAAPHGNTTPLSAAETCPADTDELTEEQKAKLPASCFLPGGRQHESLGNRWRSRRGGGYRHCSGGKRR